MARGPNDISKELQGIRGIKRKARGKVDWTDLYFTEESHAFWRKLTIRHVPTNIQAEAEGYHAGRRELKERILPILIREVLRAQPEPARGMTVRDIRGEVRHESEEDEDEGPGSTGAPG